MEAVILAGGLGSRLQPYTDDIPKPLVKVGNYPIVEILLRQLKRSGITRAHVAVNHMAEQIESVLGDGSRFGLEIVYSHEDKPLSTVGPLKLIDDLPDDFIVANGDILSDLNVANMYEHHLKSSAPLTVGTYHRSERIDFGVLELSGENRIKGFQEKPHYNFAVSMGIYVFSRAVLDHVPDGERFGFDDLMLKLIDIGEPINAFVHEGYWLDIGRPEDYIQANRDIDRIDGLSR